jgi:hypothetical protein
MLPDHIDQKVPWKHYLKTWILRICYKIPGCLITLSDVLDYTVWGYQTICCQVIHGLFSNDTCYYFRWECYKKSRGDIFRGQTRRVSQIIVFRKRVILGRLCTKHRKKIVRFLGILWQEQNFLSIISYTIYPRFLCSGTLWFAKHDVFVL